MQRRIMDTLAETNHEKSDNKGISTEMKIGGSGTNSPLMSHESHPISGNQLTNVPSSLNTGNPGKIKIQEPITITSTTREFRY